jgi:hypothetical protein
MFFSMIFSAEAISTMVTFVYLAGLLPRCPPLMKLVARGLAKMRHIRYQFAEMIIARGRGRVSN